MKKRSNRKQSKVSSVLVVAALWLLTSGNSLSQGLAAYWDFTPNPGTFEGEFYFEDHISGITVTLNPFDDTRELVTDPAPDGGTHALFCSAGKVSRFSSNTRFDRTLSF